MRSSLTSVSGVQRCGGCSKHHPLCYTARKIQPCGVSRFPADASGVRTVTHSTPRDEGCEAGVERHVCSAPRPLPSCATVACVALARWTRPLCCGANAVAGRAHTTGRGCVGRWYTLSAARAAAMLAAVVQDEGSRPHSPSCSVRSPPTSPTKVMYRQHATRELNDTPHRSQGSLS